jgi:hypothetical protein
MYNNRFSNAFIVIVFNLGGNMMILKRLSIILAATSFTFATGAFATDFSFEGEFSQPNEVAQFNFIVGENSDVLLRTYSYAGGVNSAGNVIAQGGFDPILALFDSTGQLVGQNDDGGSNVPADLATGSRFDTYLPLTNIAAGSYTATVMLFPNFAIGPNLSNGFTNNATSFDGRSSVWAFDVLGVNSAAGPGPIGAVPEPATWASMLVGFGLTGAVARHRRRKTAVAYNLRRIRASYASTSN